MSKVRSRHCPTAQVFPRGQGLRFTIGCESGERGRTRKRKAQPSNLGETSSELLSTGSWRAFCMRRKDLLPMRSQNDHPFYLGHGTIPASRGHVRLATGPPNRARAILIIRSFPQLLEPGREFSEKSFSCKRLRNSLAADVTEYRAPP